MALQKQLKASEDELAKKDNGKRLLKEEVTEADIAEIISKWTGKLILFATNSLQRKQQQEATISCMFGVDWYIKSFMWRYLFKLFV